METEAVKKKAYKLSGISHFVIWPCSRERNSQLVMVGRSSDIKELCQYQYILNRKEEVKPLHLL